ncbi:MAG: hypothetical protein A2V85_03460 [Chloroflexi bacterium RBG_16_72_14]|nr:MAG: hypothetical protein A2V85_03460 [Chloroflexi bacterium RBG_16_72_14]
MHTLRPVGLALTVTFVFALAFGAGPRLGTGGPGPGVGIGVSQVSADCAALPSIDEAVLLGEVVFVGTVLRVDNQRRWATVRVEERWRGARDLAGTVEVRGGPEPGTATSVDRLFGIGRYLFVVTRGPDYLSDNACTATTAWTADLARLRPIDVSPAPDVVANATVTELDLDAFMPLVALALALIVAVIAYLVILRARRRPADWIR